MKNPSTFSMKLNDYPSSHNIQQLNRWLVLQWQYRGFQLRSPNLEQNVLDQDLLVILRKLPVRAAPAPRPFLSPNLAGMDPLNKESGPQFVAPASNRNVTFTAAPQWAVNMKESSDKLLNTIDTNKVHSDRPAKSRSTKKPMAALPNPPPISKFKIFKKYLVI